MDKPEYRADVDGLRAVAILAVVAFHAGAPGAVWGYVGVDIFFVISGFLITGLLLREREATGKISLADFYARRVRRLAPAYGLVVAAVIAAGLALLLPEEQRSLGRWVMASSALVANLLGWSEQAGYFAPAADYLPLLHLWTLAVEEQFYLVWPLTLILLTWWLGKERRARKLAITFSLITAVSVGLSLIAEKLLSTEAVFFLTPFRAWELCIGALVAAASPMQVLKRRGLADLTGAAGLVSIGVFAVVASLPFAMHWTVKALPVIGAAAIIAAGSANAHNPVSRALGQAQLAGLGRLSYSWYLWHWPLLAFGRILSGGDRSLIRDGLAVVAALGLAWLTYHFVENPIRKTAPGPLRSARGALIAGAVILAACAGGGVVLMLIGSRPVSEDAARVAEPARIMGNPTMDLGSPSASRSVLLWGDSHARHLAPGLDKAGDLLGVRVIPRTRDACRLNGEDGPYTARMRRDCARFTRQVAASVPGLVSRRGLRGVILAGRWTEDDYVAPLHDLVRQLRADGVRVLIVEDGPLFLRQPSVCAPRHSLAYCSISRRALEAQRPVAARTLRSAATGDPDVRVVSLLDILCQGDVCPPQVGDVIMYADSSHLSQLGSLAIAPALQPHLRWAAGDNPPQLAH